MAERFQLNEQDLEMGIGGAFNYWEDENGNMQCSIDNAGEYHAKDNAKDKISKYIITQKPTSLQQVVDWAVSEGYLWQ